MKTSKILSAIKYRFTHREIKMEISKLCGVILKTVPGTIRNKTDQDDAWFYCLAQQNNVIFDIGCNVGYTALLALIQNPDRPYLLVDPNPIALNQAQLNLISNNLGFKAQYFSGFVSDKQNDSVKFYTIGAGAAGSMHPSHAESAALVNSFTQVKTVTLDFLYKYYGIKPNLVKIDVEGAEILVMNGANILAKETQCAFFVEMHNVENMGMKKAGQLMIDWCQANQYKAWYLKDAVEFKNSELIKERGKCHLLLLPEQQVYPDYLKNIPQGSPLPTNQMSL
ncbi:MAG: FkbM family methyltransferase [Gelidibacter sp.]